MIKVNPYVLGMMSTNCYLIYDDEAKADAEGLRPAVLVDPGAQAEKLFGILSELKLRPEAVLLTHGHFDHIMAVEELRARYGMPVYALSEELALMEDPELNLSGRFETEFKLGGVAPLSDGQELSLIGHCFRVIATPGHTKGGCCYYLADAGYLFSGDTLFCESYGKFTFPTGSLREIVRSIVEKLLVLPEETKVCPGHECATTIAHEKKFNICNVIYQKNKEAGKL